MQLHPIGSPPPDIWRPQPASGVRSRTLQARSAGARLLRRASAYRGEIGFERIRHMRSPGLILPALGLPMVLYALFLTTTDSRSDPAGALYWLANYVSFATIVPALYLFTLAAAADRSSGLARLRSVLPVPPCASFLSKAVLAATCAATNTALLTLLNCLTGRAVPAPASMALLTAVAMLGCLPFSALGLLIGSQCSGKFAIIVINLLILPLGIASGLLLPPGMLPGHLRAIAVFSPGHDTLALAVAAVRPDMPASPWHLVCLVAAAVVLGGLAEWRLRKRI